MFDYLSLISQHYQVGTLTYKIFLTHAFLVTNKALTIARHLQLSSTDLEFIEVAAMLHDIGVCRVCSPKMECTGDLPYIAHGLAGGEILRQVGLDDVAEIAETHIGVGLTRTEIIERQLPLPARDFIPSSLPAQIITYADLFFSKRLTTLWQEDTPTQVRAELAAFGSHQVETFDQWHRQFSVLPDQP